MSQTERQWDRNHANRMRAEAIASDALDNRLAQCEHLIGVLNSGTHYIITRSGNVKNFARWSDAAQYLIKNRYVTARKGEIPASHEMR
jgi:hypothetical protein